MSDSGSDLGSDFGEMCEEFEVDSDGNPTNAPELSGAKSAKKKLFDAEAKSEKLSLEEKRKAKNLDKLNKKIKSITKKHDKERKVTKEDPSEIKNKHKRQEVVLRKRMGDRRERKLEKLKTKKLREELGEEAVPKGITNTIESMRVKDETIITDADDEEIRGEQDIDEFASYFKEGVAPRILLTTNRRPRGVSVSITRY